LFGITPEYNLTNEEGEDICANDAMCGEEALLNNFCEEDNLMNNISKPVCVNKICSVVIINSTNISCAYGCSNDACETIPILNGLIGHWLFNNNLVDSSGHGNDGANKGVTFVQGFLEQGAYFNSTGYVQLNDSDDEFKIANKTISVWIKPANLDGLKMLFSLGGSQYYFGTYDRRLYISLVNSTGGQLPSADRYLSPPNSVPLNEWFHVVYVVHMINATHYTFYAYINGIKQTPVSKSDGLNTTISSYSNYISNIATMGAHTSTSYKFNGTIDDMRFYNRVLSQEEVTTIFEYKG